MTENVFREIQAVYGHYNSSKIVAIRLNTVEEDCILHMVK